MTSCVDHRGWDGIVIPGQAALLIHYGARLNAEDARGQNVVQYWLYMSRHLLAKTIVNRFGTMTGTVFTS